MGLFGLGSRKGQSVDTAAATAAAEAILNGDIKTSTQEVDLGSRPVREAILREVRRQRRGEHILTDAQFSRAKDALQLSTTKLENVEENLLKAREHQEWLRRYMETQSELDHQRARQFEVNKQVAVMARDEQELERYESFETIQSSYQRLTLLDDQRRHNQETQTALVREAEALQKELGEQQRRLAQTEEQRREAEVVYNQSHDIVEQALRLEVVESELEQREARLKAQMTTLTSAQKAMYKELEERERTLETITADLTADRQRQQTLSNHQRMVDHGEIVIGWVEELHKLSARRETLEAAVRESKRKRQERDERMGQVYQQYHDVEVKIAQLADELKMHRYNNHGLDSYTLQGRCMKLRSSRLMMMSAQSLWNRIATGYNLIETMTQRQNKVRLDLDSLAKNIEDLDAVLGRLRRTTKAKEYSFTLSKSQSVIQLRADLKEGIQCTVCGATHHPFHSDTMLDQNKLISDIKAEYESLDNELRQKERHMKELQMEEAAKKSERDCLSDVLHALRQRQNEDIKEWAIYSTLDASFADCSPSTNIDARTAMLHQLVENIGRDVDEAQQKLDDFNYNQKRINEICEEQGHLEQKKDDLVVRLNELNTACQVMAGQVEREQASLEKATTRVAQMKVEIGKVITIAEWESILSRGYEPLIVCIQKILDEAKTIDERVREKAHRRDLAVLMLERSRENSAALQAQIQDVRERQESCTLAVGDARQRLHRLLPDLTAKAYYEHLTQTYNTARGEEEIQRKRVNALFVEQSRLSARLEEVGEQKNILDASYAEERQKVDEWVREFNLHHPPVQYTELERVFRENKDWREDRQRIRGLRMEAQVLESKVDQLRGQLVSLQAEGYRIPVPGEDEQEILATQMDALEKQRRQAMLQIATLQHTLDQHHKSLEEQKREEEEGLTL